MKGIFVSVELLEDLRDAANESMNATTRQHQIDHLAGLIAKADALLSVPSPAGVDGLNTDRNAAFKACPESGCDWGSFYLGWKARGEVEQAIIDGLRGEVARLRANACQGGEAVEVVAYHGKDPDGGEGFVGARWPNAFGEDCIVEPLMTVAQHQRILAAATHPADQVAEPDADLVALLQDASQWFADRDIDINLARDIDAKLASLEVKP